MKLNYIFETKSYLALAIAVFIAYTILFSWILQKMSFVKQAGIPSAYIIFFFLLKLAAGVAYGYIHFNAPDHVGITDTWKFFYQGREETAMILKDPSVIFRDIIPRDVPYDVDKVFSTQNSYWNDVKHELMVKLAAILNLFSGSNYYVNVVWYNFLTMAGPVFLYRMLKEQVHGSRLTYIIAFLIPSQVFWCSGFHKEGILFTALAITVYILYRWLRKETIRPKMIMATLFSLLMILLLRSNLLMPLMPVAAGAVLMRFLPAKPILIMTATCLVGLLAFFLSPLAGIDLPGIVADRQHEFIALGGRTAVPVTPLEPSFTGFLHHLPSALTTAFLRPFPGTGGLSYLPFALENLVLLILFAYTAWTARKNATASSIAIIMITLALLNCLMIGYTVPNVGAVIRYKSVTTPFWAAALGVWWAGAKAWRH